MSNSTIELFHYQDIRFGRVHPHTHTHYEFYFFMDGTTKYFIENQQYNLEKGDILMIPPNHLHFPEVIINDKTTPYDRFVLWVNSDHYNALAQNDSSLALMSESITHKQGWHIRPSTEDFHKIKEILSAMSEESTNQELSYQAAIEGYFLQLLVLLNRITQHKSNFRHSYPSKDIYSDIIHYIHSNIRENISIHELSEKFFISKSYISKIFRQYLGISVHQYILKVKTEKIFHEVSKGKTLSEVSYEYGFTNYSSFYRQCMREYNVPPQKLKDSFTDFF